MKKDQRLIIVGGPNGSGKTTFAIQYAKDRPIEVAFDEGDNYLIIDNEYFNKFKENL